MHTNKDQAIDPGHRFLYVSNVNRRVGVEFISLKITRSEFEDKVNFDLLVRESEANVHPILTCFTKGDELGIIRI